MHEAKLLRMRQAVRSRDYLVTTHADEEMYDDDLSIHDVEHVLATGEIVERQRDRQSGEWKYLVHGASLDSEAAAVVAKFGSSGRLVIITVYRR